MPEQKKVKVAAEVDMDEAIRVTVVEAVEAAAEVVMVAVAAVAVDTVAVQTVVVEMENPAMHMVVAKAAVVVAEPVVHLTKNVEVVQDTEAAVATKHHEKEKHTSVS